MNLPCSSPCFQTTHVFLTGFLCGMVMCAGSLLKSVISLWLVGRIQKELRSQKLKPPLLRWSERTTLTMTVPRHTSGAAVFIKTCSTAARIHPSCQLRSLLWLWTLLVPWEKRDEWRCWILLVLTRVEECWRTREGGYANNALYDVPHLELSRV